MGTFELRYSAAACLVLAGLGCKASDKNEDGGEGGATTATAATTSSASSSTTSGDAGSGAAGGAGEGGVGEGGSGVGGVGEGGSGEGGLGQGGGSTSTGEGGSTAASWSIFTHSCPGSSRTDALLVEEDGLMWVGCGTNQLGYGLHRSGDGGENWQEVPTSPGNEMEQFRVSAIARGEDDLLYVAGFDANDSDMVLALDTTSAPSAVEEVLLGGNQVGTVFHVGDMALLSGDRIFAESLTGYGALWRPGGGTGTDGGDWVDAYYWANDGEAPTYQILDLFSLGDAIYGSGATISEPPYVFLPPRSAGAEPWEMEVVELPNSGWSGEMWGVAASADRVVVVGVDQIGDEGKIYVSGADPYESTDYTEIDISSIVGSDDLGTWGRGVCTRGDVVVVVGERQPLSAGTGLVLISEDGGGTFTDITPDEVTESVSKCHITDSGEVVVAGAGGFVGIWK